MQSPAPEVSPSARRRMPTSAADPTMRLLQAALDPEVDTASLRSLCDHYEGRGAAMASIPGMGRN